MAVLGAVGLVAWGVILVVLGVMLVPSVNDAVLGDKPRDLRDFTRMCEDDGSGEPFPRAASYEPGVASNPWVAVEDGWAAYSSQDTATKESKWAEEPGPDSVQLVACTVRSGAVPGTELSCDYGDILGVSPDTVSISFFQGLWTVHVREARTGELVHKAELEGDEGVECDETVHGSTKPRYTSLTWDAYADLFSKIDAAPPPPGPRDRS
ncbi:hypothetical protein O7599_27490 [Streptomyces sp. WMMC500]|uniref:hypothetical protein n=1 Tax=Streptomyces sp. WMMC500 TaxID=3015154 RepID=UPI00248D0801|nr:hypothetical protein [Streptomyces sp. WMMC500]WBB59293.1 hypothetical protein O7599_27490 [Streptomyces sp. WMMC500]